MPNKTEIKFAGVPEMSAVLQGLSADVRSEIIGYAVGKGAAPIVSAAKQMAPVMSGALRESINFAVRRDKTNGSAYAIIGPDRGYYFNGAKMNRKVSKFSGALGAERPANYAHLVEYGHATAKHGSNLRQGKGVASGTVPAKPFLRPAVMAGAYAAATIIQDAIDDGIEKSIRKRLRVLP